MPKFPEVARAVRATPGSLYSLLGERLASFPGEILPLHVGDTWMEPAQGCRMQDLRVEDHPGMHRYAPVQGHPALLDAIVARRQYKGERVAKDQILVTAGATGALGAAMGAIVDPGAEVLILAPDWPLIAGIVRSCKGEPVIVPGLDVVDQVEVLLERLTAACTERTVALYLNSPNNPTGRVLPPVWVEALVAWASAQNLWILSDEVYEDYLYEGVHQACRTLAPERTLAAYSFSKAYGMAGNRCGYLLVPPSLMGAVRKVSTHAFYSTPTASQLAAARVLEGPGDAWIERASASYRAMGYEVAKKLGVPPPQSGTFLFFDVASHLDPARGLRGFLNDCADRGLFIAPGTSFGAGFYDTHIRLCFTAAPPSVVRRGAEVLLEVMNL